MKQLTRYQPSQKHREFVRQSGFDLDHPDKRHPVQNRAIERLVETVHQEQNRRRDDLLSIRKPHEHDLIRSIAWGSGLLLGSLGARDVYAAGHEFEETDQTPFFTQPIKWIDLVLEAVQSIPADTWLVALSAATVVLLFRIVILQTHQNRFFQNQTHNQTLEMRNMIAPDDEPRPKEQVEPLDSPFRWHTSCATRTGKMRSENQDRFRELSLSPFEVIQIECDGAGGHKGGAEAAELGAITIAGYLEDQANCDNPIQAMNQALTLAQQAAIDAKLEGITTTIIAWYQDDWLHFATLGDGNLAVIWPDGMVSEHLTPHHTIDEPKNRIAGFIGRGCETPPRFGSVRLEVGCQVLVMSDGAGDLFPYEDYARQRERYRELLEQPESDIAAKLLKQFEEARHPENGAYFHRDNMTLLMASLHQIESEGDVS